MKTAAQWFEELRGICDGAPTREQIMSSFAACQREAVEAAMGELVKVADDFPKGNTVENVVCYVLKKGMERIAALAPREGT